MTDHRGQRRLQRQPCARRGRPSCRSSPPRLGLPIRVCHFPPGTSKWNKIEHRLFCHISQNWRGRPLRAYETIINLIGATTTSTGLTVTAQLDTAPYPTGVKVSGLEMKNLPITRDPWHGEWNYTISAHSVLA